MVMNATQLWSFQTKRPGSSPSMIFVNIDATSLSRRHSSWKPAPTPGHGEQPARRASQCLVAERDFKVLPPPMHRRVPPSRGRLAEAHRATLPRHRKDPQSQIERGAGSATRRDPQQTRDRPPTVWKAPRETEHLASNGE